MKELSREMLTGIEQMIFVDCVQILDFFFKLYVAFPNLVKTSALVSFSSTETGY